MEKSVLIRRGRVSRIGWEYVEMGREKLKREMLDMIST